LFGRILPSDSSRSHHAIVQVWRHPTHTVDECVVTATVVRWKSILFELLPTPVARDRATGCMRHGAN
jgi:hypothetical protein